ncbi:hypothetical protein [Streptomyces sp. NBC_00212]|uniref:hypothetical protein n=1 Tax=Streptomyces sp. NBC_00212 TaxID=2975684 RepID=UPI002F91BED8
MPPSDTPTETVDATLYYAWQRRAQQHLADFIEHGARNGLPPLLWTLAPNGNLIGTAGASLTPDVQREAVTRWAAHVGVPVDTEHTADGREELYAGWKDDERRTRGCFRATIFLSDEVRRMRDDVADFARREGLPHPARTPEEARELMDRMVRRNRSHR